MARTALVDLKIHTHTDSKHYHSTPVKQHSKSTSQLSEKIQLSFHHMKAKNNQMVIEINGSLDSNIIPLNVGISSHAVTQTSET